jgi:hypothetical protein
MSSPRLRGMRWLGFVVASALLVGACSGSPGRTTQPSKPAPTTHSGIPRGFHTEPVPTSVPAPGSHLTSWYDGCNWHTPEGVTQRACTMLVPDAPETSTSQPTP